MDSTIFRSPAVPGSNRPVDGVGEKAHKHYRDVAQARGLAKVRDIHLIQAGWEIGRLKEL